MRKIKATHEAALKIAAKKKIPVYKALQEVTGMKKTVAHTTAHRLMNREDSRELFISYLEKEGIGKKEVGQYWGRLKEKLEQSIDELHPQFSDALKFGKELSKLHDLYPKEHDLKKARIQTYIDKVAVLIGKDNAGRQNDV